MSKYLNPELVCKAFERLLSTSNTGKVHMERSSVLMYFLAVDAACKHFGTTCLDLNPNSLEGKNCRKQVELEFTKLVLVDHSRNVIKQVTELGKIDGAATSPEKRISSNFFTVPLKKATTESEPFYYPRRPAAPVLKMGAAATGNKWGVCHHEMWGVNLLVFLSEIKSPTPFLDLAIFVFRDCEFDVSVAELVPAITEQIKERYTRKLSDFWADKIQKQMILARHLDGAPFTVHHSSFVDSYNQTATPAKLYDRMTKSELIARIYELETMLSAATNPVI